MRSVPDIGKIGRVMFGRSKDIQNHPVFVIKLFRFFLIGNLSSERMTSRYFVFGNSGSDNVKSIFLLHFTKLKVNLIFFI